jgi:hypothetical protein
MSKDTFIGPDTRADAFPVGTMVLFDHFGGDNRSGKIVKRTASSIHIEWTAPSSGTTRIVKISTKLYRTPAFEWTDNNGTVHAYPERIGSEFGSKNVRMSA